jgi:solute carrier family 25 iron transporter 28/37
VLACLSLLPLPQHMLAGAAAGITEHTAMYPVDTIKTRMQALSHPGQRVSRRRGRGARTGGRLVCNAHTVGMFQPCRCLPWHAPAQLHGSVINALRAVLRREGVGGLYRGVGAVIWGAG